MTAYDAMVADIDLVEEVDIPGVDAAEVRYVRYKPIFPTSAREMLMLTGNRPWQGDGADTEKLGWGHGTLIASVSVEHPARTTPSAGAVRARLVAGGWTIAPCSACACASEACANADGGSQCKRKRTAEDGWPEKWSSQTLSQCCGSTITLYAQVDPGGWIPVSLSNWAASELPMKVLLQVADICGGVPPLAGKAQTIS